MILVTGATGTVGREVALQLLEAGEQVRAISRDPASADLPDGVEVLAADLSCPDERLDAALAGVSAMYLLPVFGQVPAAVEAAARAGVEHIVMLSSQAVTWSAGEPHIACEDAVRGSGLRHGFVRTGALMANDLNWLPQLRSGVVRGVYGMAAMAPIDERDIAAVVVGALLTDRTEDVFTVTGPASLTQVDRVRMIGEFLGRETRYEELPREHVRQQMARHMALAVVDELLDHRATLEGTTAEVLSTVEDVTGRPPRVYEAWLDHHEAKFRAAV
jgi:uncharacterized protein YbjT (DUF2867 family)